MKPLLTGFVAFTVSSALFLSPLALKHAAADTVDPKIAGHRGTTVKSDENTIPAMKYAYDAGADILETDVRLTSDSKMVIMHDATLDRTTDCTGKVASRTLAYIKACTTPRGYHPPSLRQLLTWVASQDREVELYLELKGSWSQTRVQGFVNEASNYGIRAVTASSFSTDALSKVGVANDNLPDGREALARAFIENGTPTMSPFRVCERYDGYHNNINYLTEGYVEDLQVSCNPPTTAVAWGRLDSAADFQAALATGAWVWTVEDPKQAIAWLAAQ